MWIPARTGAHPAKQTIAASGSGTFAAPAGANGFYLGADNPFYFTIDGSAASVTNGLYVDPGKGSIGLVPVTVKGQLSIFNPGPSAVNIEVCWLEQTDD